MEISNITRRRINEYLSQGKRFDGRNLLEYRPISIDLGISKNADGSARVRIGKTEVFVGVKMSVAAPYPDSAEAGVFMVTTELSPLASERYELGPPGIESIEMARLVDRGLRESGFIEFEKLCIKKGEKVWCVFLDIYPMNDDGNVLDAACIASIAALQDTRIPEYDQENDKVNFGHWTDKRLPLTEHMPLTMTFHKIGKTIILDPSTEEGEASEARLTIAISPRDKKPYINAMQKGNEKELTQQETFDTLDTAGKVWQKLYPEILEKIDGARKKRGK
ncbi:MAG: exosome complex protein Rrp42 [archaeon]